MDKELALVLAIAAGVGISIAGTTVVAILRRWQAQIDRQERGEEARGFPIKPTDTNRDSS